MTATDLGREPTRHSAPRPTPPAGVRSWVCLGLGAALLPFTMFQMVIPAAGWLAPILLLRFTRTQRARVALPVLAAVGYAASLIALRGTWGAPQIFVWSLTGTAIVISYGADRFTSRRLRGAARTLVFPALETAVAFLLALDQGSAFGSWGTPGYTQVANLPLAQTTSIAGVWGLSFLLLWLAPAVNELWERGFDLRASRRTVAVLCAAVLAALLFGGARLALSTAGSPTVQTAALAPDRQLDATRDAGAVSPGPRTADERARADARYLRPALDDLFTRTRRAARAGARIVAWSEAAGFAFKEDEAAVLREARAVAREEGVYLQIGMVFILPTVDRPTNENRSILIDPTGTVRWDYAKSTMVPGDGNALGSGVLPVVDTPYGRLSGVICFDADFPWLVRQAGRAGVDILLVPSSDWGPIGPVHADMAVIRAIENGLSILRPTRRGVSIALDPHGRTLARSDWFTADDQTMFAAVPTERVATLYPVVGDIVGWSAATAAVVLIGMAAVAGRPASATRPHPGISAPR